VNLLCGIQIQDGIIFCPRIRRLAVTTSVYIRELLVYKKHLKMQF
jgi:hypothetical protein